MLEKKIDKEDTAPHIEIDTKISLAELSIDLIRDIESLGPFGFSNPEPTFSAHGVEILGRPKLIGVKGNHLKMKIKQDLDVYDSIGFYLGHRLDEIKNGLVDIVFVPELNQWNGHESIRLRLKDIRISQSDDWPSP